MKKFLMIIVCLAFYGASLYGSSRPALWSSSTIIDLKVDQKELVVNVPYPDALGDRSFCGVEILVSDLITNQEIQIVSQGLLVRDGFSAQRGLVDLSPMKNFGHSLSYRIASKGTYMTYIWIKAPKHKTLKEYFSKVLPRSSKVFLHGFRCDDARL